MLTGYTNWVRGKATNKAVLGAVVAFLAVEGVLGGWLIPRFRARTGGEIPDLMLGYSYGEMRAAIEGYGTAGRELYGTIQAVDVLFPLVYGALLTLLLVRVLTALDLWDHGETAGFAPASLLGLPLVAVTVDYIENAGIALMLTTHPGDYAALASVTSLLTLLKFATIGLSMLAVLGGGLLALSRRWTGQPAESPPPEPDG